MGVEQVEARRSVGEARAKKASGRKRRVRGKNQTASAVA